MDLNGRDNRGRTPLMESDAPAVTRVLLEAGADPYLRDGDGKTALDLAQDWQKTAPGLKAWMAAHPPK